VRPLHGCRVIDLGIITAGAATSAMLADLGAEVIKIESINHQDPFRVWLSDILPATAGDLPSYFRMTNRNKRSVCLDLKQSAGRAVFLQMVAESDIVVENFSRGVMQRLGLEYSVLQSTRPEIILASISSQGETGPDAHYVSFGSTLEAMAGMAWTTGYVGGSPFVSGNELNYPDQVAAIFACGLIVSAWRHRLRHGKGAHLDLSQRELTAFLCGDTFAGDGPQNRMGNEQSPYYLQDCFVCADRKWIAVSIEFAQHAVLTELIGIAPNSGPEAFSKTLTSWTASIPALDCVKILKGAGIAASPVNNASQVLQKMGQDWHWAMLNMPDDRMVKGFPFQLRDDPLAVTAPAVPLGTDTIDVLRRVAGLSDSEISNLIESKVAIAYCVTPTCVEAPPK